MFRTTRRIAILAVTLTAAVGGMSLAAASALAAEAKPVKVHFENWVLSGSVTAKKLNEPITLPPGSTFNGEAVIQLSTFSGPVTGSVFVPPWNAPVATLGTVGLNLTEVGKVEGTFIPVNFFKWAEACPTNDVQGSICVTLAAPVKVNLAITSVGALGIPLLPTTCETSEPISLNLNDTLTVKEIYEAGPHFTGTTTFPPFVCHGAEALVVEPVLNTLISGSENPYSLSMTKPAAKPAT